MNYQNETARVARIRANMPEFNVPTLPPTGKTFKFSTTYFDLLKKVVGTLDGGKMGLLLQEDIFTQEYR